MIIRILVKLDMDGIFYCSAYVKKLDLTQNYVN